MQAQQMRSDVAAMYDGPAWKERVSRMPDRQIYAIWHSNEERKAKVKTLSLEPKKEPEYQQLTIWDWAISEGLT